MKVACGRCGSSILYETEESGGFILCSACGSVQRMPFLAPRRDPSHTGKTQKSKSLTNAPSSPSGAKRTPKKKEPPPSSRPIANLPIADLSDTARRNSCPSCQRLIANDVWYSSDTCPYCHDDLDDGSADEELERMEAVDIEDDDHLSAGELRHLLSSKPEHADQEAKLVAEWMVNEINRTGEIFQRETTSQVEALFGSRFIYRNNNGNPAIHKDVLAAFRMLTKRSVVWNKSNFSWRKRRPSDDPTKRVVE